MTKNCNNRKSEKGNVLFLILIAVALFAALSYAVTQSTRSGGGSTEREKAILSSASMTQGPTAMRTALIRMVLGGVDVADLLFNTPSTFGAVSDKGLLVFHPTGGGAVYQRAPADLMTGQNQGTWFYNASFDIPEIGTDGSGGNDIIAFLPGVTTSVCRQVNEEFAISTTGCTLTAAVPNLAAAADETKVRTNLDSAGGAFPTADEDDIQGNGCTSFTGQPSGCFYSSDNGGENVYYSVLLER